MKKMLKLLSAMAVLVCGIMMTGCVLDNEQKEVLGPNGVWCEFKSQADNKDASKGTYYFKYVDGTDTTASKFSIAFVPAKDTDIARAFNALTTGGNKTGYYLKEYTGGEEKADEELGFEMTQGKWIIFYMYKLKKSSLPANVESINFSSVAENVKSTWDGLTWKQLLKNIVLAL